jgi:hypothetical protein
MFKILDLRTFTTSELRRFEIPDLRTFATSELRRFEIPDLRTFTTSELHRFKIPDLRKFDVPENSFHECHKPRPFEGDKFSWIRQQRVQNKKARVFVHMLLNKNITIFSLFFLLHFFSSSSVLFFLSSPVSNFSFLSWFHFHFYFCFYVYLLISFIILFYSFFIWTVMYCTELYYTTILH